MNKYISKQQKIDMYTMRLNGYSFTDIAVKYHTTRQNVHRILHDSIKGDRYYGKMRYPAIRQWILDSEASIQKLHGLMHERGYNGAYALFCKKLKAGTLTDDELSIISKVTDMSLDDLNFMDDPVK